MAQIAKLYVDLNHKVHEEFTKDARKKIKNLNSSELSKNLSELSGEKESLTFKFLINS